MITSESPGRARRVATLLAAVVLSVLLTPLAAPAGAAGLNRLVRDADIAAYCRSAGYSGAVLTRNDTYG